MSEFFSKLFEQFETYGRLLGPVYLTFIAIIGGLGYFILEMRKINLSNKLTNAFPSDFAIQWYFYGALAAALVVLLIILTQTFIFEKIRRTQLNQPVPNNGTPPSSGPNQSM